MKPLLLRLDNLDDRREIHQLLARLPPSRRVEFLEWCCQQAARPERRPFVRGKTRQLAVKAAHDDSADKRLTLDLYFDVWYLASQYGLDLQTTLDQLVERVRHG